MTKSIAKKTLILYVLKMLYQCSSRQNPITITGMTKVINSLNVPCDRRTVSRNVDYLIEFGLPIVKLRRGGCYYDHTQEK